MKFIVSSSHLLKELTIASSVISSRVPVPILENFLFSLEKNKLFISASDLESSVKIECSVTSDSVGSVCVPSKIFLDYLKNIYEQPLSIEINDKYDINIVSDKGRYKLKGEDPSSFPKDPKPADAGTLTLSAKSLQLAIEKTIFAVSNDEVRLALMGIYFEKRENHLRLVSTDAHRLAYYDVSILESSGHHEGKVIVPKKAAGVMKSFLSDKGEDNCDIRFSSGHLFLKTGNIHLISRLVDSQYPDYKTVIPQKPPYALTLDREELSGVVSRLTVFSNRSNNLIIVNIEDGRVKISANDNDFNREGVEEIQGNYEGENIRLGFNGKFLHEILRSISEKEVLVKLSTPQKPVLIVPLFEGSGEENMTQLSLIMPLIL